MLIRRNITRVVKDYSGVVSEVTSATDTPASGTTPLVLLTTDKLYIGFKLPFASRYFQMGTLNTNAATLTVKYWDGSAFTAVEDLVDQTSGLTANGFISWQNQTDWAKYALTPITDVELYWIEITTSANFSSGTTLQAVLNIFCDDSLLRSYYPELITDTRWLPDSRTDFLEQYVAAKDLIVLRLKQDGIIEDEAQIIDPNEVAVAATHAAAKIIMFPNARNEEDKEAWKAAEAEMVKSLNRVKLDLDINEDGVIQDDEKETGNIFRKRG